VNCDLTRQLSIFPPLLSRH